VQRKIPNIPLYRAVRSSLDARMMMIVVVVVVMMMMMMMSS
jgi:hypothetical protein